MLNDISYRIGNSRSVQAASNPTEHAGRSLRAGRLLFARPRLDLGEPALGEAERATGIQFASLQPGQYRIYAPVAEAKEQPARARRQPLTAGKRR